MKLRIILAATALGAVAAPAAWAQTPPVGGEGVVGGTVPSFLELILPQSGAGFSKFPRAKTYTMNFNAEITSTDGPTLLTLADGDATSGSKLGHLSSGAKRLPLPLEARVGRSAFQRLDQSVDPLLNRWSEPGTRQKATVQLRQKVKGKTSGSYRKVVLVTVSTDTP